jgi:hypothetical protein
MPKLYRLSGREVIYFLEKLGFAQVRQWAAMSFSGKRSREAISDVSFRSIRKWPSASCAAS